MHLKHLCVFLTIGNVLTKGLSPGNMLNRLEGLKNLNWEKTSNIVLRNSDKIYKNNNLKPFYDENPQYQNSSLITLTPGGLRGFYNLGTCVYTKENYDLTNYFYSGVSAGAWNGLMMTYKKNPHEFAIKILDSMKENHKLKTIYDTQLYLKNQILESYDETDFELQKLFIGVTCIHNNEIFTNIYSDFLGLEDAINCCIASSNIPFITGNCEVKYNNLVSLDGGFSLQPYLKKNITMQIGPDMWNENVSFKKKEIKQDLYKMFFYNNNNINFYELYIKGYSDARDNSKIIDYWLEQPNDKIFTPLEDGDSY
jgi:hypothetical protein